MMRDAWMEVLPPATDHYASSWGGGGGGWFMPPRAWTADENKQFERALAGLDLRCPDWDRVARATGKTVVEVVTHFKDLEVDVHQIESGLVPFPVYAAGGGAAAAAAAFTLQWDGGHGGVAGDGAAAAAAALHGSNQKLEKYQNVVVRPRQRTHLGFHHARDGESIIPFRSNITSRFSSGYAEASSSTHSNNYLSATEPMAMTFQELRRITDGFSEERLLGKGGFGIVYKGVLDDGEVIAVKKLNPQQGLIGDSFKNEIQNLMRVQHQNIISLVGYCEETRDRLVEYEGKLVAAVELDRAICLEYMQGGSLEKILSDESCGLDWEARYRIIKGMCQGLKHLHTGSKNPIYHLDLNPANILLDKDQIPKIGDFGLSRLLASTGTFVTETKSGTRGYMPPEYTHGQQISSKFDVFSLGIIIIQVIAGPEGYYKYKCVYTSPKKFMDHVTQNWSKRVQARTMSNVALQNVKKCIKMALRCVEGDRAKRPTITEIVKELNMIS